MDKSFILFVLFSIYVAKCEIVNKVVVKLPAELGKQISATAVSCKREGDDVSAYLKTISEGKYNDEPNFQKFIRCMCKATGFANEEGKVYTDKISALFPEKESTAEIFTECNKESGHDDVETNYLIYKCFQKRSPYTVSV